MSAIKQTSAAAFRSYVESHPDKFIEDVYFGFDTAGHVMIMDNVKGKAIIPNMIMETNLIRRYSSSFAPVADAFTFGQNEIEVGHGKSDLRIIPTDFEASWLGEKRKPGQNVKDLPFEQYILSGSMAKKKAEQENAFWNAVKKTVGVSNNDVLTDLFDGAIKKVKDAVGSLSPIVTGALTIENTFTTIETMYMNLPSEIQALGPKIYLSNTASMLAGQYFRREWGKYTNPVNGLDWAVDGGKLQVCVSPGLPRNKMIMTLEKNIWYGCDAEADATSVNFEDDHYGIDMFGPMKMGAGFAFINQRYVQVNDQFVL